MVEVAGVVVDTVSVFISPTGAEAGADTAAAAAGADSWIVT